MSDLKAKKERIETLLRENSIAYESGLISKEAYLARNYEVLGGKFKEEVLNEIDEEIKKESKTKFKGYATIAAAIFLVMTIPFLKIGGLTGFAVLGSDSYSNLTVNESIGENRTLDYSFIQTDTVRISGNIYGEGETWVYLVNGDSRKLVYYANTRTGTPTGLVTGVKVNETNISAPQSRSNTNTSINETNATTNESDAINQTSPGANSTNITSNETVDVAENETSNETATPESNVTNQFNETILEVNGTNESVAFAPEIITRKEMYGVGENISIEIKPNESTSTVYMHTPTDTYYLPELFFVPVEAGEHKISAIITLGEDTERLTKDLQVVHEQLAASFENVCVETCAIEESELTLEVLVDGTVLELERVLYNAPEQEEEQQQEESVSNERAQVIARARSCLVKNPNLRPRHCFTEEEIEKSFPDVKIDLINDLGDIAAKFNKNGDIHIRGELIENTNSLPQDFDLILGRGGTSWIDTVTGDLYLTGTIYENQETIMWQSKQDYVINNREGMYLGVFTTTGDLYIRGIIVEGRI